MPTTKRQRKAKTKANRTPARTQRKSRPGKGASEVLPQKLLACGIYGDFDQARKGVAEFLERGFSREDLSAKFVTPVEVPCAFLESHADREPESSGVDQTARVAGSMLALGTAPLLAPMLLTAPLLARLFGDSAEEKEQESQRRQPIALEVTCRDEETAERAAKLLEGTGAQEIGVLTRRPDKSEELKAREYFDASGMVHHHTRTYMREHGAE